MNHCASRLGLFVSLSLLAATSVARADESESDWFDHVDIDSLSSDVLSIPSHRVVDPLAGADAPSADQALIPLPPAAASGASVLIAAALVAMRKRTPLMRPRR